MTHTNEEITKALSVIKTTCSEVGVCMACPFYLDEKENCVFSEVSAPASLEIANKTIWRAVTYF